MEINKQETFKGIQVIGFMTAFLFAGAYIQYTTESFLMTAKFILTIISLFTLFILPKFVDLKTGMLKTQPKEEVQTPIIDVAKTPSTTVQSNNQVHDVAQSPISFIESKTQTIVEEQFSIKNLFVKTKETLFKKQKLKIEPTNQEQFTTKEQIKDWLDKHNIEDYTINKDLTVDVDGHVKLERIEYLPFKFGRVEGSFSIKHSNITSLKNSPDYVGIDFEIVGNTIKSLEHSPKVVKVRYRLYLNKTEIENLIGITHGATSYVLESSKIKSLQGLPNKIGDLHLRDNQIRNLDFSPKEIQGLFDISNNKIDSLKNGPTYVRLFYTCRGIYLKSLEGCPEHCYQFNSDNFSEQDYRNYNENRLAIEREKEATLLKAQLEEELPIKEPPIKQKKLKI